MNLSIFWVVLALLYLGLAIYTLISSKPVIHDLTEVQKKSRTLLLEGPDPKDNKGNVIDFESTTIKFFKGIITIDIIGFLLAATAAFISMFIL